MSHAGELAALGTATCWLVSALTFEAAGKRIGTLSLNLIRLVIGLVCLSLWGLLTRGMLLPTDATPHAWFWLSLSALAGFVFGDLCLFRAFIELGPRLSSLVMSFAPVLTAALGYLWLGETLEARDLAGMAMTVAGIGWAVLERGPRKPTPQEKIEPAPKADRMVTPSKPSAKGIALAFCGALGQASGLVLSKLGMGDYDPFAATQIRVIAGIGGFIVVCTAIWWWPRVFAAVKDKTAMKYTTVGAIFGPFLGVALSLVAVQLAPAGIAAAIMATTPILLIPAVMLRGEQVGIGGILGALIAVAGVAILFL